MLTCNTQEPKVLDDTRTSASLSPLTREGEPEMLSHSLRQLCWERGLGQPGSQAPCLPPSVFRDNPPEPGKGGQGLKPQINDISVASNAGTINPIIYRVASGLNQAPFQTMAVRAPARFSWRDCESTGPNWAPGAALWDSPPCDSVTQGEPGNLREPRSSAPRKICLV